MLVGIILPCLAHVIGRHYGTNIVTAGHHASTGTTQAPRDRLVFRDDITQDEVFLIRRGDNLEVVVYQVIQDPRARMPIHLIPMELIAEDTLDDFMLEEATNRTVFVDFFRLNQRRVVSITFPSGCVITLDDILSRGRVIYGTDGDDEINITDNHGHFVFGFGGDDVIRVTGGGNNIIDPGTGNNRIYGGTGTDTYVIGRNYGINIITAGHHASTSTGIVRDMLVFRDDIRSDDVFFAQSGNNLEVIIVEQSHANSLASALNNATNVVVFVDFFRLNQRRIVNITFPDGTEMTQDDIFNRGILVFGTDGDDEIIVNSAESNHVFGFDGDDVIRVTGGGNNIIDPGTGSNRIYGGAGVDTFVIGRNYGTNTITAGHHASTSTGTARDLLVFRDDIHPDEVFFMQDGNNLQVIITDYQALIPEATNRIVFIDFFRLNQRHIVNITFSCGTILTQADIIGNLVTMDYTAFIIDDLFIIVEYDANHNNDSEVDIESDTEHGYEDGLNVESDDESNIESGGESTTHYQLHHTVSKGIV